MNMEEYLKNSVEQGNPDSKEYTLQLPFTLGSNKGQIDLKRSGSGWGFYNSNGVQGVIL